MIGPVIARFMRAFEAHNAINVKTVKIYFQTSPGVPGKDKRGIEGLDYQVMCEGIPIQGDKTDKNGLAKVRIAPGVTTTLRILGSEYEVSLLGGLHPIEQMRGVQQRLTMLGYKTGPLHVDGRLAKTYNNPDIVTERTMLEFQADHGLFPDAMFGTKSEKVLKKIMKDSKAE